MICPCCGVIFIPLPVLNNDRCAACVLIEKRKNKKSGVKKICSVCKENEIPKGRSKYCSKKCLIESAAGKMRMHWSRNIRCTSISFKNDRNL